ncbi:MAG: prolyl oligopeptidase family serine peptidase [Candidatus Sumerlaeota bacterium]|nr:prolyl oligopeptidase family serine peptidase [Candidatus Sumerlaeota bacterium]
MNEMFCTVRRWAIGPFTLMAILLPFHSEAAAAQAQAKAASQPASKGAARAKSKAGPRAAATTNNPNFQKRSFTGKDGETLEYWLMTPKDYDPKEKYPLLLALHGSGGTTQAPSALGTDEMREKHRWFVMAPKAPEGWSWASARLFSERIRELKPRLPLVFEAMDALEKEFSIDPRRLYVTGQSMGGVGTYGALAAHPDWFAAAAPVCGAWDVEDAPKFAGAPIWIFHGGADPTVPVDFSRNMVEALKKAGASPRYTEFPGVGHNSWLNAYAMPELWDWMEAQRLAAPAGAPAK